MASMAPGNINKGIICFVFLGTSLSIAAQDFIRIGIASDFRKSPLVQTFTFDLNRTEKVEEKEGKYFKFTNDAYYILPSCDVNIGKKVTATENNITFQVLIGRKYFGIASTENYVTKVWNTAIEVSPSYVADKEFNEQLVYGQIKKLFNFIRSKSSSDGDAYTIHGLSVSFGPFTNIGFRDSDTFDTSKLYFTTGGLTEVKWQFFKNSEKETDEPTVSWQIKASGNCYFIINDLDALGNDDLAGILKVGIDKKLYDTLYLALAYKIGNDTPLYTDFHALELSVKFNY